MNRRLQWIAVAALGMLLAGCGRSADAVSVGLVTGPDGTGGSAEVLAVSSGIDLYAADHSVKTRIYTASADTAEAYAVQFDAAAEDEAEYVFCEGASMEIPVYQAQNQHGKQKFVLFDGEPRQSGEYEATIKKNTLCVTWSVPEMGFLAGYTAVREGYRNIFYLGSEKEGAHLSAYNGFLSGVEYALKEQSLSAGNMTVSAEFAGTDALSPLRFADALKAFDGGAELIVTDSTQLAKAAGQAAMSRSKAVATIGFDGRALSDGVLFGSVPDREGAAEALLTSFYDSNSFSGGQVLTCGAREQAVTLAVDYARFSNFTESGMRSILSMIADGTVEVAQAAGADAENETGSGEVQHSFAVASVAPVTGNSSSGLAGGAEDVSGAAGEAKSGADETGEAKSGAAETGETDSGTEDETGDAASGTDAVESAEEEDEV